MDNIYVYKFEGSTYINLTNRCNCACTFCIRQNEIGIEGYDLWLEKEPTAKQVIEQLDEAGKGDVVFCGYGEPTMALDVLKEVAAYVHSYGGKTRLNTNGLANAHYKRNIVPELKGLMDVISISLNEADEEKYDAVVRSKFGRAAYGYMLDFARECVKEGIDTVLTVVDVISKEDIEKCKQRAADVGAKLRVREYSAE